MLALLVLTSKWLGPCPKWFDKLFWPLLVRLVTLYSRAAPRMLPSTLPLLEIKRMSGDMSSFKVRRALKTLIFAFPASGAKALPP